MVDLAAVATTVTAVMGGVGPYLGMLKGVAGKVLDGAEKKLGEKGLELLTRRLTGKPADALKAAEAEPDEMNLAMLEAAVKVVASTDEGFLRELGTLLKEAGGGPTQSSVVTGNDNVVKQVIGSGNFIG